MMKVIRHIATLLASIFFISSFAQSTDFVSLGFQRIDSKDYPGAIEAFSAQLKQQPKDSMALSGIIRAYMFTENYKDAQRYIDEGIKFHPSSPEFYYRRGLLNNIRGQFRKAITDFDKAYSLSSGNMRVTVLINRGIANLRDESPDKALSDFDEALTINPRSANAYGYKGFLNHKQGNFADAIADFNKAIDLDNENVMNYYNRGVAFLRLGDKAKACADFHKACSKGNMNACKMIVGECSGIKQE
jgi:tetratricopeptide (TPR) repeat protein